jgi:hypothetical protein
MKRTLILLALITLSTYLFSQQSNLPAVDKSPMDMIYYPDGYPVLKIRDQAKEPVCARVIYSRPQKSGRTIFGDLVPYGEVWRMGANEATEIEFYKNVMIDGKKIAKGRYTMYAIANENTWTIILNRDTDTWGSFAYKEKMDVARINVPVQQMNEVVEFLSMDFEKTSSGMDLIIAWDNVKVTMPIKF